MRTRVFTLLVLLFSFSAKAQYYAINLDDYALKQPVRDFKIHQFIDLRFDQSCLGMVQAGIRSKKMPADFESNFLDALDTFITHNSALKQEPFPVILKVNKFMISERTETSREYATASIALEFLAQKDSGYVKLAEVSSFVQSFSRADVTNHHEENIVKALEECLVKFAAINIPEKLRTSEIRDADYLRVNSYYQLPQFNLPILKEQSLKKGVYNSFSEFFNNAPGSTEGPKLTAEEALELLKLGNQLDGLWGFSDGKTAYVLFMDSYFPLSRKDDYFTFKAYLPTINKNAIAAGGVVGGLTGALVAHALTANHEATDFAVNMITGKPVRFEDYNPQADINKAATIFVYRKANKQAREKLSLYVNDSLYAGLSPLTYQELHFKYPVSEVKICLNGPDQQCLKITPTTGDAKYIEFSLKKKPGSKPEILTIPEKEGKYYLKIVKHYQDRSGK